MRRENSQQKEEKMHMETVNKKENEGKQSGVGWLLARKQRLAKKMGQTKKSAVKNGAEYGDSRGED